MNPLFDKETFKEIMMQYDSFRKIFEKFYGEKFSENKFHDWFSEQVGITVKEIVLNKR